MFHSINKWTDVQDRFEFLMGRDSSGTHAPRGHRISPLRGIGPRSRPPENFGVAQSNSVALFHDSWNSCLCRGAAKMGAHAERGYQVEGVGWQPISTGRLDMPRSPSANQPWRPCANIFGANRNITKNNRSRMSCGNGCDGCIRTTIVFPTNGPYRPETLHIHLPGLRRHCRLRPGLVETALQAEERKAK